MQGTRMVVSLSVEEVVLLLKHEVRVVNPRLASRSILKIT